MSIGSEPRVAFFPDSYWEVNGVALTSRQLAEFAGRRGLPFLTVHAGPATKGSTVGSLHTLQLNRSRLSIPIDHGLRFDPLLARHRALVADSLRLFQPDVIHVTGPSDLGLLGAALAHQMGVPLVASWHTNLHEYAGQRFAKLLPFLATERRASASDRVQDASLWALARFYRIARVLMAPNQELIDLLRHRTGKECFLMQRGVDTTLFDPVRRTRTDDVFTVGYVGRLTPEKNVRFLATLEQALREAGRAPFRILVVGQGSEEPWLRQHLRHGEFAGVRRGEALAEAYANMDVFVFPSHTDTFGNVVQEALASGVPAIVTTGGGPKFLVRSGETGFVAADDRAFVRCVRELMDDATLLERLRRQARAHALTCSWERVFERVYSAYEVALRQGTVAQAAQPATAG